VDLVGGHECHLSFLLVRIASLVPSATEMLFALGLGDHVVGVTHECDFPAEASERSPQLTRTIIPEGLSTAEIDRAVRERTERGEALYELDAELLRELEPDLIVTQAVCTVCAVSFDDVRAVAEELPGQPQVLSLDPATLGEVLAGADELARAAGVPEAGERVRAEAAVRIDRITVLVAGAERPRVAALEWLDPIFLGGHWVPQMIELAGGEDLLGLPGERSRTAEPEEIAATAPHVAVAMPCGYDAERSAVEVSDHAAVLERIGAERVVAVDASSYFSRPGPRLVDGVELLGHVLHPGRVEAPPAGRWIEPERSPRARSVGHEPSLSPSSADPAE
jgi:iron complex transport system substrate-binding protein